MDIKYWGIILFVEMAERERENTCIAKKTWLALNTFNHAVNFWMINQCLVFVLQWSELHEKMLQTPIEDCFQYTECKVCHRLPTHSQPMARSRESTCVCVAMTPSKAQTVWRLSGWNFLYAQHSFFLSIDTAVFGKKPFISNWIQFLLCC